MTPVFIGSGVALVTPFDKDGKINYTRFKELIEYQIAGGTDAIIVCGTTGEGSTLTTDERLSLFSMAAETVNGRLPVICATGSNSTSFSLELAKNAEKYDIDAHLIVTPYYNKTSQEGLINHYYTIAESLSKPVIVYNVPTRTGMNITPETYQRLSLHENIVGVKEADSNISKLIKSIVLCDGKLDFYIGNDDLISAAQSVGCKGVVSVLANILPSYTHEMTINGINYKGEICSRMQKKIMDFVECLFVDVSPTVIKNVMNKCGLDVGQCRPPLYKANTITEEIIDSTLNRYSDLIKSETENFEKIAI